MNLSNKEDLAFAIRDSLVDALRTEVPDLLPFFPFRLGFAFDELRRRDQIVLRLIDVDASFVPVIGSFENRPHLAAIATGVLDGTVDVSALRDEEWWSPRRFSYTGPAPFGASGNWPALWAAVVDWVNQSAAPEVVSQNKTRVLRAIPEPPAYDPRLIDSVVIVDDGARQGSAFHLDGVGFVSCDHAVHGASRLHTSADPTRLFDFQVVARNAALDLAILSSDIDVPPLLRGASGPIAMYAHIAALGFPNYQLGDSGVLMPGIVVGSRQRSGVTRVLTNSRIVGGMSGGPVVAGDGRVVGVCVTGADRLDTTEETEDHGVIPVNALDLLLHTSS